MYGPPKGDMQFLIGMAFIGIVAIVVALVLGIFWLFTHIQFL